MTSDLYAATEQDHEESHLPNVQPQAAPTQSHSPFTTPVIWPETGRNLLKNPILRPIGIARGGVWRSPQNRINDHANAVLEAWYPGEEGGAAVAETLSGENNTGGKLPVTFSKDVSQLPHFEDYEMTNRTYRYFKGKPALSVWLWAQLHD